LSGRIVGIGAATALALGQAGANVVLALKSKACRARGRKSPQWVGLVIRTDVSIEQEVRYAVDTAVSRCAVWMVRSTTQGFGTPLPLHNLGSADFNAMLQTNVMGVFWSA
jgi:NAD(P)-dependent dehydrogenase (short-subunit alcohol dehydrogenase family)